MTLKTLSLILLLFLSAAVRGQDFHIVFLNKKADKKELPEEEVKKLMDGHMANINRLASEGKLWAAGPFDGGGGIFIFKTASMDDVSKWILTDPAVAAGRWNVELFPYTPRIGSVCTVGEKYEMTNYFLVRYTVTDSGNTERDWKRHEAYVRPLEKDGSLLTAASLGEKQGAILVFREEPSAENLKADPAVKSGTFTIDIKKLYIAKGAFCEPR